MGGEIQQCPVPRAQRSDRGNCYQFDGKAGRNSRDSFRRFGFCSDSSVRNSNCPCELPCTSVTKFAPYTGRYFLIHEVPAFGPQEPEEHPHELRRIGLVSSVTRRMRGARVVALGLYRLRNCSNRSSAATRPISSTGC